MARTSGLRVVAGTLGGRRLRAPACARPMTERVREAVFSTLGVRVEGAHVLDLFAGSGALAIEALSRGAARAVLVDREPEAMAVIRKNLIATDLLTRARAVRRPVATFLGANPPREAPFGLIFCDPPYDLDDATLTRVLERLGDARWSGPAATTVIERASVGAPPALPDGWVSTWERAYGDTLVVIASAP